MRLAGAVLTFVLFLAAAGGASHSASAAGDPVIAAAGDIACGAQNAALPCHEAATSDILLNLQSQGTLSAVLPLGDEQYECGELSNFYLSDTTKRGYDRSWGRLNSLAHPVVGNHEYLTYPSNTSCLSTQTTSGAPGYFTYFGYRASPLDGSATAPCAVACKGY